MSEIVRLEHCASTMDEARKRASEGMPDGTVVVANSMSGGRGTHGRPWHAPEGGLYMSIIIRDLQDPQWLSLALGNAVADTLEVAGIEAKLKWVNDVWVDDKKIAGILVEAESTGAELDFIIAGIGINANDGKDLFPDPIKATSTTMQLELGGEQCIEDLETLLLQEIDRHLQVLRAGRGDEVVAAWRPRDALTGRNVKLTLESGGTKDVYEGKALGVDAAGHLRIATPNGEKTFQTGTVTLA